MTDKKESIRIETLTDIMEKVPPESIDVFLKDLKNWYAMNRFTKTLMDALPEWSIQHDQSCINWIDSGENEVHLDITIK